MTVKELEELYQETATTFGILNVICSRLYPEEKLLYMGLMETYHFIVDEDDR